MKLDKLYATSGNRKASCTREELAEQNSRRYQMYGAPQS
jgi:hypothetical protein